MEEIRNHDFNAIAVDYASGGTPGNTFALTSLNGTGTITTSQVGGSSELLQIQVDVAWQNKKWPELFNRVDQSYCPAMNAPKKDTMRRVPKKNLLSRKSPSAITHQRFSRPPLLCFRKNKGDRKYIISCAVKDHRGVTLVEVMTTVVIFSFILGICYALLISGSDSWETNSTRVELQQELRKAMDWITPGPAPGGIGLDHRCAGGWGDLYEHHLPQVSRSFRRQSCLGLQYDPLFPGGAPAALNCKDRSARRQRRSSPRTYNPCSSAGRPARQMW